MLVLLASIHCVSHRLKTGKQNTWNANLIRTYFIKQGCECNVESEQYRNYSHILEILQVRNDRDIP